MKVKKAVNDILTNLTNESEKSCQRYFNEFDQ